MSRDAQAEMRQGLSYFQSTIFSALPVFYRRIDTALKQVTLCASAKLAEPAHRLQSLGTEYWHSFRWRCRSCRPC